jgi:hypothetical protein
MQRFADAGAISPKMAVMPEDIGCRQRWIFRGMVSRGVFVSIGDGRFYMDVEAAAEFKRRRRTRAIVFIAVALLVLAFWLLVANLK